VTATIDPVHRELVADAREALGAAANPDRAAGMRAYMKSAMPYRGVRSPEVDAIARRVFAAHPLATYAAWQATALELWRTAEFREERYLAVGLTGERAYREYQVPAAIPMYAEMIVTGAWWDHVDELAIRRVGPLLISHRAEIDPLLRRWSHDPDLCKPGPRSSPRSAARRLPIPSC